jgi:glycosyltransferase involved in cell wall biosynthesis
MLRRACRESDAISAQSQTFADFARQHGARGEIHVCYLGANAPTFPPFHLPTFPLKRSCRLLYLGSMGRSYDLATLLTATLNLLRQGLELELHIAGGGQQLEALKGMAADAPAGAIHFHGFLQEPELSELLRSSDVGVVPMFPESGVAVPYKVGDYLSAGLAVVNSLPGELDELLQESNCGRFYEAKSVTSLEGALKHYLEKGSINLLEDKKNARALFERHFDHSKTYPNFAKWIAAQ